MRRTRTLTSLLATAVLALSLGGYAYAHPLGFESDLSEDGVVNVCNPDGARAARVAAAVAQWNAVSAQWGTPTLRQVTGTGASCELTVEEWGGARADFYARVVFGLHPDRLQISARFTELPVAQGQAVITHEFGHVLGLDHPPADATLCAESVMTTMTRCGAVGAERRSTPGPHDNKADLFDYWVEGPIYPIKNKCWDSACSDSGPPAGALGASSSDGGAGGGRKEGTGDPSGGVRAPDAIKD